MKILRGIVAIFHRNKSTTNSRIKLSSEYFFLNTLCRINAIKRTFSIIMSEKNVLVFIYASVLRWNTMQNVRRIRIVLSKTVKMNAEFAAGAKSHHSANSPHYSVEWKIIPIRKRQLNAESITQTTNQTIQ